MVLLELKTVHTPTLPTLMVDHLPRLVPRQPLHPISEDEAVEEGVGAWVGSDHRLVVIPTVQHEEGIIMFLPLLLRQRLEHKHQWTGSNLTMRCFDQGTDRHRTITMPRRQWTLAYRLSDDKPVLPHQDQDLDKEPTSAITPTTMVMAKEVSNPLPKVMALAMETGMGTGTGSPMRMGVAMGILRIGDLHQRNHRL